MTNKTFIGCSGFTGRELKGFFYPQDLPSKEQLTFYAEKFNAVEINSTFYRRPLLKTLEKWYDLTADDFKFFIKIPKSITHIKKLSDTADDAADFCNHIASGLKEKLAGFLFQLPPSFHYNEENLEKVLHTVDEKYLNVVEFRHNSWWNDDVYEALKKKNIVFSGVSIPKDIPPDFMVNNEQTAYYRLHGLPVMFKSEYTETELEKLAEDIKKSKREVYVFFNNTWGTSAIKNGLQLQKILDL